MPKTKTVALDGTTESGFQYTIPPDAIDDYELLKTCAILIMEMLLKLQ